MNKYRVKPLRLPGQRRRRCFPNRPGTGNRLASLANPCGVLSPRGWVALLGSYRNRSERRPAQGRIKNSTPTPATYHSRVFHWLHEQKECEHLSLRDIFLHSHFFSPLLRNCEDVRAVGAYLASSQIVRPAIFGQV
jgi:hypothetical protein